MVGVHGTILIAPRKHLKEIGTNVRIDQLQRAAVLGTARTLRRNPEI